MPNATLQVASTPEDVRGWPAVLAADVAREHDAVAKGAVAG
jgi:hypothetical protein